MQKQCRSCAMFVPQTYDGVQQPIGRCLHIAFLKAGFAKAPEQAGGKPQPKHISLLERLPHDETLALHDEGYFYQDHIDIKLQRGRFCQHWRSPTVYVEQALAHFGDTIETVRNFPGLSPALAAWIDAGMPTEITHYSKLNKISNFEYDAPEVPQTYLDYEACNTCRHFEQDMDDQGTPIPFRGKCKRQDVSGAGVFNALSTSDENPTVYTFMGCNFHTFSPSVNIKEEPTDLPTRLTIFVETNPLELSVADFEQMYKFPTVTRNRQVDQEDYDELMSTDLVKTLRTRHKQIDFNSFYADMALQPVADFFSKGLKQGSAHHKQFWGQFDHYKVAEDSLFGEKPVEALTAEDEQAVMSEFGSSLAIPDAPAKPVE